MSVIRWVVRCIIIIIITLQTLYTGGSRTQNQVRRSGDGSPHWSPGAKPHQADSVLQKLKNFLKISVLVLEPRAKQI